MLAVKQVVNEIETLPSEYLRDVMDFVAFLKFKHLEKIPETMALHEKPLSKDRNTLKLTTDDINKMLKGSITESLIGSIPQSTMSLEDYRAERLKKYESVD